MQRENDFIPVLTSQAGSCLTLENWRQAGITGGVYYLDALIIKPGMSVLQDFDGLRQYGNWFGTIIVNACLQPEVKTGDYVLRSPYDGKVIRVTKAEMFAFVAHLQADYVIWAEAMIEEATRYFQQYHDERSANKGAVFLTPGLNQNNATGHALYYSMEQRISTDAIVDEVSAIWFESDQPAADGMRGIVYTQSEILNLLESQYQKDFSLLAESCACLTCQEGHTRAYLHHLLQHTPLLAQRFLILHNVFYYRNHHLPEAKFSL